MMVKFFTLLTFVFDINRDLLIKDLIKFEVLGSKCMRRRFTIYSEFLDIKNKISYILISRNEIYFLISRNRILDIKKSISWYQEKYFEAPFYYF